MLQNKQQQFFRFNFNSLKPQGWFRYGEQMNTHKKIPGILLSLLILASFSLASGASSLDYTLKIFGNANMDEDLNNLDVAYVEDILAGKADKTTYADANNDGFVNKADLDQIKSLIDNTASSIIIQDSNDRVVTLPYPIQKIICLWPTIAEPIQAMGAADKIIAIDDETAKRTVLFPDISAKPSVGKRAEPDIEEIVNLDPDFVVTLAAKDELIKKIEDVGIPVVITSYGTNDYIDTNFASGMAESKLLGYLLGVPDKAEEYIQYYGGYLSGVEDKISTLSETDRPEVLYTYDYSDGKIQSSGGACYVAHMIDFAGGHDITSETPGSWIELDPEFPIKENPQVILYEDVLSRDTQPLIGYGQDDSSRIKAVIDEIKVLPGFDSIDAVKDNQVYAMPWGLVSHCSWLATLYQAKIYHPELFGDLDVPSIHKKYLEEYLDLGPDAYEKSIFVYPVPEGW